MNQELLASDNDYKIVSTEDLKLGLIVVGIAKIPDNFYCSSQEAINFLQYQQVSNISVLRNGKDIVVNGTELQKYDKVLKLGLMKNPLRITLPSHIDFLKKLGVKQFFITQMVENEVEVLKLLNPNLTIDDFYRVEPMPIVQVPLKSRFKKNVSVLLSELYQMQDHVSEAENVQEYGYEVLSNAFEQGEFGSLKSLGITTLASRICNNFKSNPKAASVIMLLKDHDEYTYRHCVDVANQLLFIIKYMGNYEDDALQEITIGALFHDVGKSKINKSILNKPSRLDEKEWEQMKMHPVYSAEIMKKLDMTQLQMDMGLMHHVRKDGSGYPVNIDYDKIHEVVRLLMIVDVYQALVTKRPYRITDTPSTALKRIRNEASKHFDVWLTDVFIKACGVYPVGSFVRISDSRYGFVISNDRYSLKPVVMICMNEKKQKMKHHELIDLSDIEFRDLEILEAVNHRNFFQGNEALEFFVNMSA